MVVSFVWTCFILSILLDLCWGSRACWGTLGLEVRLNTGGRTYRAACLSFQTSSDEAKQKLWSNPGPENSFSRGPSRTGSLRSKAVPSTARTSPTTHRHWHFSGGRGNRPPCSPRFHLWEWSCHPQADTTEHWGTPGGHRCLQPPTTHGGPLVNAPVSVVSVNEEARTCCCVGWPHLPRQVEVGVVGEVDGGASVSLGLVISCQRVPLNKQASDQST